MIRLKILLLALLVLTLMSETVIHVNAQAVQYQTLFEILPSQGGANTAILLRFVSLNASVQNVTSASIFWDDVGIQPLNQNGTLGADGAYYYNLTVPTEPPYSNVGNHTIRVNSNITPYGQVNFTFTFNITAFISSPEYLALNDTYNSLLTNYTAILGNFNDLSANYTTLLAEHNNDTLNFNTLTSQYNVLNSNYNSLSANYNLLQNNYGNLTTALISLSSSYTSLQTNFQNLNSSYVTLIQDYNLLNSSYAGLLSNYNSITGQLDSSRNLNYILIITTIALAITTIYFAVLKPKKQQKTR